MGLDANIRASFAVPLRTACWRLETASVDARAGQCCFPPVAAFNAGIPNSGILAATSRTFVLLVGQSPFHRRSSQRFRACRCHRVVVRQRKQMLDRQFPCDTASQRSDEGPIDAENLSFEPAASNLKLVGSLAEGNDQHYPVSK